jgi:hypothetical protein
MQPMDAFLMDAGASVVPAVALAMIVLLAGCGGGEPSPAGSTSHEGPSATTHTTSSQRSSGIDANPTPIAGVNETAVRERVLEALAAPNTYRMNGTVQRSLEASTGTIETTVSIRAKRNSSRLLIEEITAGHMRYLRTRTYVIKGTAYLYSDRSQNESGGTWRTVTVSKTERWRLDPLLRQRTLLKHATVVVANRTTVRNISSYIVYVDVNETAYERLFNRSLGDTQLNITALTYKYTVAIESGRLIEARGILTGQATRANRTLTFREQYTLRFYDYGESVTVTIPKNVTQNSTSSSPRVAR